MSRSEKAAGSCRRPSRHRQWLRGFNTAVSGNAQAFGFSITVTATYGVISSAQGSPSVPEIFGFALAAVAAFSLLNLLVAKLLVKEKPRKEPDQVVLVATATDFLAVGSGIAAAVGLRYALTGWPTWVLAPFTAALVYVLVQALEMTAGLQRASSDEK